MSLVRKDHLDLSHAAVAFFINLGSRVSQKASSIARSIMTRLQRRKRKTDVENMDASQRSAHSYHDTDATNNSHSAYNDNDEYDDDDDLKEDAPLVAVATEDDSERGSLLDH
jgi:hypothetical protein